MSIFAHPDFDHHEQINFVSDEASGLKAIIAVHNTNLGYALGGTRFFPYANDHAALTDVLRLSRGMSYKSAMARLALGGGKSVIIGHPSTDKNPDLLRAFGRALEGMNGRYVAAEDSGTSVADMKIIHETTEHVSGYHEKIDAQGQVRSGDPSPATAYGCFVGIKAAVEHQLQRRDLNDLVVGVQGLGSVGFRLARLLHEAGARLLVTDINAAVLQQAQEELGAHVMSPDQLMRAPMDIFAPCALGGAITPETLTHLQATIVAGGANNQLDHPDTGDLLHQRGICYAPDYVINAGGIIDIYYERLGTHEPARVNAHIDGIHATLMEIFQRSAATDTANSALADTIARERLMPLGKSA
ncbi:amino acid dehydrogenase [Salinispirillum sp. LH 10-3-1]|uniref:Amino acid dehydrogenase n=1 Tax=Salinispirillum sp. LH 10-3-1 TaxID=2952525 RepID=A0AB38YBK5_9GAMM